MLFCWCLVGRARGCYFSFFAASAFEGIAVALSLISLARMRPVLLCFLPAFSLCCFAAETPYFAPNRAFPSIFTRLEASLT